MSTESVCESDMKTQKAKEVTENDIKTTDQASDRAGVSCQLILKLKENNILCLYAPVPLITQPCDPGEVKRNEKKSSSNEDNQTPEMKTPVQTSSTVNVPISISVTDTVQKPLKAQDRNKIIAGDRMYVCNVKGCSKIFYTPESLSYHQAVHQGNSKKKTFVCTYEGCGRKFEWPSHYKYHLLTHSNDRIHQCGFEGCDKNFLTLQRLKVHLQSHKGERPYKCTAEGCSKSFLTMGNLRNHHRIHTGEKPFKCPVQGCKQAFTEISSLNKHGLVHSGAKPFSCQYCGKLFSQSGSRNIHVNRQHRLKKQAMETATKPHDAESNIENPTSDSTMVVNSQSNILVLTHYEDQILQLQDHTLGDHIVTVSTHSEPDHSLNLSQSMLSPEEVFQSEVDCLTTQSNVVVLSQPEELVCMGQSYELASHEEIVYDNDLLNSGLDVDHHIETSALSINEDLESQDKETSAEQIMASILNS